MAHVDTSGLTDGFRLRASPEEVATWRAAAAEEGVSVAAWLRAQAANSPSAKDARRAHAAVTKAVKEGVLVRQPCEVCGAAAQAHHDDYSQPLVVRWLCGKHHRQWHKENPTQIDWAEMGNGKAQLTAKVSTETREIIVAMAKLDGRSVPSMTGLLAEAALGFEFALHLTAEAKQRYEGTLAEREVRGEENSSVRDRMPDVADPDSRSASVSKTGPAEDVVAEGETAQRGNSPTGGLMGRDAARVGGASKCPMVVPVGVKCKACGKPHTT